MEYDEEIRSHSNLARLNCISQNSLPVCYGQWWATVGGWNWNSGHVVLYFKSSGQDCQAILQLTLLCLVRIWLTSLVWDSSRACNYSLSLGFPSASSAPGTGVKLNHEGN